MGRVDGRHHVWPSYLQKRLEKVSVRFDAFENEDDRPVILIFLLTRITTTSARNITLVKRLTIPPN